jgi:hypothetical protein
MKVDFKYLQYFHDKTAQRKSQPSLQEASKDYDFVLFKVGVVFSLASALTIDMSRKYLPFMLSR